MRHPRSSLKAFTGAVGAARLALAIGAPSKARAFNGNGKGELLAALADGFVFGRGKTKSHSNDFVNLFQNFQHSVLSVLQIASEVANLLRQFRTDFSIGWQIQVLDVLSLEFVFIRGEQRDTRQR